MAFRLSILKLLGLAILLLLLCVYLLGIDSSINKAVSSVVIREHPKNMYVPQGSQVTFICQATGDGDITYLWQRVDNGSELDLIRTSGINSNELIISSVSPDDAGSYICIASNKNVKTESRIAILDVQVNCPIDISIHNGEVKFSRGSASVVYQCANGFRLLGSASATCKEDGTWSSPPPKCIEWQACQWSMLPNRAAEIAEQVAADPLALKFSAMNCDEKFHLYLRNWPTATINDLCQNFGLSNLTSSFLQYSFMYCTGLKMYAFLSDAEGNVQVPDQFHNCKKMSFRNSGIPTLLVSYPGSGNSWVRQLLEATTGIYTGSNRDCDINYIQAGMFGEGIVSDNVIAVKFHVGPLPEKWQFKRVIYIIRNPYDATIADYQRQFAVENERKKLSDNPHMSELNTKRFGDNKDWKIFVNKTAISWRLHVERWLGSTLPYNSTILVIKYENLLTDLRTELIRMMKYLEYPYIEEDLDCALKSTTNFFHRTHDHSNETEYFMQSEVDLVYEQIKAVDKFLKNYNINYEKYLHQT